jgi:hypothetical protein
MRRRIFGLERMEITGCWRKLHNEELHKLYSLTLIIRIIKMRWVWYVACLEEISNAWKILVGDVKGKSSHWRCKHRFEDNIEMGLKEIGYEG